MLRTSVILAALLILNLTPCQDVEAAELKVSQRIYRSAHFLGRADTGIADADNQEAIFYNPAGVASGKGIFKKLILGSPQFEISKDTRDLIRQIAIEKNEVGFDTLKSHVGETQHVGASQVSALVLRRAALSGFVGSEANILIYKSRDAGALESADANFVANGGGTFSVAESFFSDSFLVGVTGKYLRRGVAEASFSILDASNLNDITTNDYVRYGSGLGADLGFMLRNEKAKLPYSLGLTVENMGSLNFTAENSSYAAPSALKQTVNFGLMLKPGTKVSALKILMDYRDLTSAVETNRAKKIALGAELNLKGVLGLMLGLHQGYPTGGVFLDFRVLRLDLAGYTQEMGEHLGSRPDPRYVFRLTAGF